MSSQSTATGRTPEQNDLAGLLASTFQIDPERIYFLNPKRPAEPWIPPDQLMIIARQATGFQAADDEFQQYIEKLNQVVHKATVIDRDGRAFSCVGVATIGEPTPEGEEYDAHKLAYGRALSAALTAAGFHPLKPGSEIPFNRPQPQKRRERNPVSRGVFTEVPREFFTKREPALSGESPEALNSRVRDLARIHLLAEQAGLIFRHGEGPKDYTKYRAWLLENYDVDSVKDFSETHRKSVINALNQEIAQSQL